MNGQIEDAVLDKQQRLAYKIGPATRYINLPIDLTPLPLAPN